MGPAHAAMNPQVDTSTPQDACGNEPLDTHSGGKENNAARSSAKALLPTFTSFYASCCYHYDIVQVLCILTVNIHIALEGLHRSCRTSALGTQQAAYCINQRGEPFSTTAMITRTLAAVRALVDFGGPTYLLLILLHLARAAVALARPQQYVTEARTPLTLAIRLAAKLFLCAEMLHSWATGCSRPHLLQHCKGTAVSLLLVMLSGTMHPLPLRLHFIVVWLEAATSLVANLAPLPGAPTPQQPPHTQLLFACAGVLLSTAAMAAFEQLLGRCYYEVLAAMRGKRTPLCGRCGASGCGSPTTPCTGSAPSSPGSPTAATSKAAPTAPTAPAPSPGGGCSQDAGAGGGATCPRAAGCSHNPTATAPSTAAGCRGTHAHPPSASTSGSPGQTPPTRTTASTAVAAEVANPFPEWRAQMFAPEHLAAARADAARPPPLKVITLRPPALRGVRQPYRSLTDTRLVAAKIQEHSAYDLRDLIIPPLHTHLHALCAPAPTLITTTAARGCLQLVFTATTIAQPPTPPTPPHHLPTPSHNALPAAAATTFPPLQQHQDSILSRLHSALPRFCHADTVTLQLDTRQAVFPAAARSAAAPTAGTQFRDAAGSTVAAASRGVARLLLEPVCVEAGRKQVLVAALEEWVVTGQCEVDVVVSCMQAGQRCVLRLRQGLAPGSCGFRLSIPATVEAGPLSIYIINRHPAAAGTLLAACSTMALPPAAAAEVSQATAALGKGGSELLAGLHRLLSDYAAAWQLLELQYDGCLGAALLAGVMQYCSDSSLGACLEVLQQRCLAAGWLVQCTEALPAAAATMELPPPPPQVSTHARRAGAPRLELSSAGRGKGGEIRPAASPAQKLARRYWEWKARRVWRLDQVSAGLYGGACLMSCTPMLLHKHTGEVVLVSSLTVAGHVLPHLVLALGRAPVQRWRVLLMALQTCLRCACLLLQWAGGKTGSVGVLACVAGVTMEGFGRPLLQQVPWGVQLLLAAAEAACRLVLLLHAAGGRCAVLQLLGLQMVAVVAAVGTSLASEGFWWASYRRSVRAGRTALGAMQPMGVDASAALQPQVLPAANLKGIGSSVRESGRHKD